MSDAADQGCKFVFERADVRGELVQLEASYGEILSIHQYAPGVSRLLGEFLSAAVLLSTTIKFEGRLVLQARSDGEVPLMMAECSSDREIRGIARGAEQATSQQFSSLLAAGQLAITIEPLKGQHYQGIVALDGDNLAQCLEYYFSHSEQLPTRLWLASDNRRSAGMLLQQLPPQATLVPSDRDEFWNHLCTLANTLDDRELLELGPRQLLHRLYHEDPLRLFAAEPVRFACSCSRERSGNALLSLGSSELDSLFEEQPTVTIDCEFCNQQYHFRREDFSAGGAAPHPGQLH
jgi:molecular chaperone Hsp33